MDSSRVSTDAGRLCDHGVATPSETPQSFAMQHFITTSQQAREGFVRFFTNYILRFIATPGSCQPLLAQFLRST